MTTTIDQRAALSQLLTDILDGFAHRLALEPAVRPLRSRTALCRLGGPTALITGQEIPPRDTTTADQERAGDEVYPSWQVPATAEPTQITTADMQAAAEAEGFTQLPVSELRVGTVILARDHVHIVTDLQEVPVVLSGPGEPLPDTVLGKHCPVD